jgi:hypothetical protein
MWPGISCTASVIAELKEPHPSLAKLFGHRPDNLRGLGKKITTLHSLMRAEMPQGCERIS